MSKEEQRTILWSGQTPEFEKLVMRLYRGWTKADVERLENAEEQRLLENEILKLQKDKKPLPKKCVSLVAL